MPDEPTPDDPKKDDPAPSGGGLGAAGEKALKEERDARRKAERELKELQTRLDALESGKKSTEDQLTDQISKLTKDIEDERQARWRAEIAAEKGLTPAQARRLTGTTRDELADDADDLIAAFGTTKKDDPAPGGGGEDGGNPAADKNDGKPSGPPPTSKPKPDLGGGLDPSGPKDGPVDPAKLADAIPRP